MRPLIEILEDERTLMHKLESVYRYLVRTNDTEAIDILMTRRVALESDLEKVRNEIRDYLGGLINELEQ